MTNSLIDERAINATFDSLQGTDGDIAFGKLRHIIGWYERHKIGRHIHASGTMIGQHIDKCATCDLDLRDDIHLKVWEKSA